MMSFEVSILEFKQVKFVAWAKIAVAPLVPKVDDGNEKEIDVVVVMVVGVIVVVLVGAVTIVMVVGVIVVVFLGVVVAEINGIDVEE